MKTISVIQALDWWEKLNYESKLEYKGCFDRYSSMDSPVDPFSFPSNDSIVEAYEMYLDKLERYQTVWNALKSKGLLHKNEFKRTDEVRAQIFTLARSKQQIRNCLKEVDIYIPEHNMSGFINGILITL